MSFDDYAKHIYQKYRLAVALSILNSKPPNIITSKYLEDLKSKFDDKMDDDDVTVCSDDFLIDDDDNMDDSVNILKDFDIENVGNENLLRMNEEFDKDGGKPAAMIKQIYLPEDLSQTTFYESSMTENTPNITQETADAANDKLYDDIQNLNQNDVEKLIAKNVVNKNDDSNVKANDSDRNNWVHYQYTEKNNQNSLNNKEFNTQNDCEGVNSDKTYYDSQKTILYTVHGYTQNYTHYSPSQNNMIIPNNHLYGVSRNIAHNDVNKDTKIMITSQNVNEIPNETDNFNNSNAINDKSNKTTFINTEFESDPMMNIFSVNNNECLNKTQDNIVKNNSIDSNVNATINNTDTINNNTIELRNSQDSRQFSQNIYEYFEEMQNLDDIDNIYTLPNKKLDITQDMDITNDILSQNIDTYSQNLHNTETINKFQTETNIQDANNIKHDDISKKQDIIKSINENNGKEDLTQNSDIYKEATIIYDDEEELVAEEYASGEVISYKVLEEFNKVKTYLNRQNRRMSCDGYSTDSGYRSDSQIRNSNRSALQLSGNWINQSGSCLFNYIMQCPLVVTTRDITNEIARVLSQLIDRLHEEEKYPSFLEEILETVDVLLRQMYEGASSGDSEFLKKDEKIQRVLLLNKSIHIQKHAIEKISIILETFHSKVTEIDTTYELTNIDEIENITYIFHILEILLKKYLKRKDVCSQSNSQFSQEEKILKKSSISDIWRKKWNPNQKVFEGSREKKCVLKVCSEILNKIIVDCLNGYSLVAFSALKCFNSMQS